MRRTWNPFRRCSPIAHAWLFAARLCAAPIILAYQSDVVLWGTSGSDALCAYPPRLMSTIMLSGIAMASARIAYASQYRRIARMISGTALWCMVSVK
jgi:hypothetical protein